MHTFDALLMPFRYGLNDNQNHACAKLLCNAQQQVESPRTSTQTHTLKVIHRKVIILFLGVLYIDLC